MLSKAHRNSGRQSAGFTLVELLVVIAVIALLMGMLLPSLKSARDRAKQTVCSARLKQWGVAFGCYAAENTGVWPHCDGLDRGPRPIDDRRISKEDLADWHGWVDVLPPMIDLQPWREHPRFKFPGSKSFYQCPAAEPLDGPGTYSYRPERDGYFSYAMNSCLELDKNAWPPPDGLGYPMPSFLDTARIRCPQRVYLLFDQLLDPRKGFDAKQAYRGAGKHSGSYPKSFTERHRHGQSGLGGNILYCDGHADWRKSVWKAHWDPDQEVPPRNDPNWYPYRVEVAQGK
jgi:prepilin-type N-terminal cleavage/methylation domain-containing protein/prepilin-type processing-associated H-X9-DG protein